MLSPIFFPIGAQNLPSSPAKPDEKQTSKLTNYTKPKNRAKQALKALVSSPLISG
jgi:hypothetical protein